MIIRVKQLAKRITVNWEKVKKKIFFLSENMFEKWMKIHFGQKFLYAAIVSH